MEAGLISAISETLTLPIDWIPNNSDFNLTLPDGSTYESTPLVSDSLEGKKEHTFTVLYTPPIAGYYRGKFTFTFQGSQAIPVSFFVTWSDVASAVRTLLGQTPSDQSDEKINNQFYAHYSILKAYAPGLPEYYLLSEKYRTLLDLAFSYLVAASIRRTSSSKNPSGEIILFKKGTTTIQYSVGPKSALSVEDSWQELGEQLLLGIPEIALIANAEAFDAGQYVMTRGPVAEGNLMPSREYWNEPV